MSIFFACRILSSRRSASFGVLPGGMLWCLPHLLHQPPAAGNLSACIGYYRFGSVLFSSKKIKTAVKHILVMNDETGTRIIVFSGSTVDFAMTNTCEYGFSRLPVSLFSSFPHSSITIIFCHFPLRYRRRERVKIVARKASTANHAVVILISKNTIPTHTGRTMVKIPVSPAAHIM